MRFVVKLVQTRNDAKEQNIAMNGEGSIEFQFGEFDAELAQEGHVVLQAFHVEHENAIHDGLNIVAEL